MSLIFFFFHKSVQQGVSLEMLVCGLFITSSLKCYFGKLWLIYGMVRYGWRQHLTWEPPLFSVAPPPPPPRNGIRYVSCSAQKEKGHSIRPPALWIFPLACTKIPLRTCYPPTSQHPTQVLHNTSVVILTLNCDGNSHQKCAAEAAFWSTQQRIAITWWLK